MPKLVLLMIALAVVVSTTYFTLFINNDFTLKPPKTEMETAVNQAKLIYASRVSQGTDFSNGPCLTDALMPGWVADIAHNARQEIDDLVENQCPGYIEGRAKHFVELDPNGKLIRVK